jgi:Fic family protein
MALARSEESPQRFYSMSAQIRIERKAPLRRAGEDAKRKPGYYTPWMEWFLGCLNRAFDATEKTLGSVLHKARFWEAHANTPLNDGQRLMLNTLLDGFEGKLTSSKWAKIAKTSQDTALRDVNDLVERSILTKDTGGGRSTSYSLTQADTAR